MDFHKNETAAPLLYIVNLAKKDWQFQQHIELLEQDAYIRPIGLVSASVPKVTYTERALRPGIKPR